MDQVLEISGLKSDSDLGKYGVKSPSFNNSDTREAAAAAEADLYLKY